MTVAALIFSQKVFYAKLTQKSGTDIFHEGDLLWSDFIFRSLGS